MVQRRIALVIAAASDDGTTHLMSALRAEGYDVNALPRTPSDVARAVARTCGSCGVGDIVVVAFAGWVITDAGRWPLQTVDHGELVELVDLRVVAAELAACDAQTVVVLDCYTNAPEPSLAKLLSGSTLIAMAAMAPPSVTPRATACTALLADALSGGAAEADGRVTVDDIDAFLQPRVASGTRVWVLNTDDAHSVVLVPPVEPIPVLDDDVRFTVYRPRAVEPQRWYSLLAFAHKTDPFDDPDRGRVDPTEEVRAIASRVLDGSADRYDNTSSDAQTALPRGSEIRFVPVVDGVEFNPPSAAFSWDEAVQYQNFRFRAAAGLTGTRARGRMSVFLGAVLIGDVSLTINVQAGAAAIAERRDIVENGRPYRKIFASYSHDDVKVVQQIGKFMTATGDRFVRDWVELRSGEVWNDRLFDLIRDADVFELFWSSHSMNSEYVQREWEYALSLNRENFVRPVFWERPMPERPADGLPPPELARLHFQAIDFDLDALRPAAAAEVARAAPTVAAAPASPALPPLPDQAEPPAASAPAPVRPARPGRRPRRGIVATLSGLVAGAAAVATVGAVALGSGGGAHRTSNSTLPASHATIVDARTDTQTLCLIASPATTTLTVVLSSPDHSFPARLIAQVSSLGSLPPVELSPRGFDASGDSRYEGTLGPFATPGPVTWTVSIAGSVNAREGTVFVTTSC